MMIINDSLILFMRVLIFNENIIFTPKKYSDDELSVKSLNGYKYVNSNNSFLSAVKNEYTDYLRIQRN